MTGGGPGWHPDPMGSPGRLRYWDGEDWTEHVVTPNARPGLWGWVGRHRVLSGVFAAVVVIGLISTLSENDTGDDRSDQSPSATDDETSVESIVEDPEPEVGDATDVATDDEDRESRERRKAKVVDPPATYLVTEIVDGDTIELGNGETVRLVGIDTPERGECGYKKASERLAALVAGKQITLGESDEDRDRYGRLLRYVDAGSLDAGLRLLQDGLAVARYDSRDGYGFHPREPKYIAADKGAPNLKCSEPKRFVDPPAAPPAGNCSPGYMPCVPAYPPDLDCPDVNGPIAVTGSDPHGLDADHDGTACE